MLLKFALRYFLNFSKLESRITICFLLQIKFFVECRTKNVRIKLEPCQNLHTVTQNLTPLPFTKNPTYLCPTNTTKPTHKNHSNYTFSRNHFLHFFPDSPLRHHLAAGLLILELVANSRLQRLWILVYHTTVLSPLTVRRDDVVVRR